MWFQNYLFVAFEKYQFVAFFNNMAFPYYIRSLKLSICGFFMAEKFFDSLSFCLSSSYPDIFPCFKAINLWHFPLIRAKTIISWPVHHLFVAFP